MLTLGGLVRYLVFFVMQRKTRRVEIAGIACHPDEAWMTQVARNLSDARDGFLRRMPYVILDREPLDTAACRRMLQDRGVQRARLPARSPHLNACAERFVGSVTPSASSESYRSGKGTFGRPSARLRALSRGTAAPRAGRRAHRAHNHRDRNRSGHMP